MTDVNFSDTLPPEPAASTTAIPIDLIELLFFAYRDFTSDPDAVLAEFGFGRAHHRVLHFVSRNPGLRVTDLLAILRITKQSLARVLKQLVEEDYISQEPGPQDRRERLLFATAKGKALAARLTDLQTQRIRRALTAIPAGGQDIARQFLYHMIDPDQRGDVARLIEGE
ncbi:MarR family winged helix-turn-helix transcriptional regulator [Stappia sp. MMSF_3263]|uniref:MarR family winged helix-turn-helix transcriptional regulator n=1 Tax=Stappia sp. MMSF_3263 TaxID=3046693 RepID=UPI00273D03DC|nr:MarR family transcriptional regulator [Stappia sp. MMSF_3263]